MNERQQRFIKALAKFLTEEETLMSVKLSLEKPDAKRWAALRGSTPLCGYYDGEEGTIRAEEELTEFLYGKVSKV
jgi:hypothetical protein